MLEPVVDPTPGGESEEVELEAWGGGGWGVTFSSWLSEEPINVSRTSRTAKKTFSDLLVIILVYENIFKT